MADEQVAAVEVVHPLSASSRPTPKSRRTVLGIPRTDSSSSPSGRPVTYFDLQATSLDPAASARTPRPPGLPSRHSSREYPSLSPSSSVSGLPATGLSGETVKLGSDSITAAPSPALSPFFSPGSTLSGFSFPFSTPRKDPSTLSPSSRAEGSRTPKSFATSTTSPSRSTRPQEPDNSDAPPPSLSPYSHRPSLILTKEEEAALEARYDLMDEAELKEVVGRWEVQQALTGGKDDEGQGTEPLFPKETGVLKDHPLRVLGRAARKLQRVERESGQRSRASIPQVVPSTVGESALQTDLQEALSTSLETSSLRLPQSDAHSISSFSRTFSSPSPSRTVDSNKRRNKNRNGSISTLASFNSAASGASANSTPASTALSGSPKRALGSSSSRRSDKGSSSRRSSPERSKSGSWMGMWGWRGGPQSRFLPGRTTPDAVASDGSHSVPTQAFDTPGAPNRPVTDDSAFADATLNYPPYPTPLHFRAIFLSTRLLSANAVSLFSGATNAGPLISRLAFGLVLSSRERNISIPETRRSAPVVPKAVLDRRKSQSIVLAKGDTPTTAAPVSRFSKGVVEQPLLAATSALSRALNSATGSKSSSSSKRSKPSRSSTQRPSVDVASSSMMADGPSSTSASAPVPSVELESIEPQESRPPTLVPDRSNLRRLFSSGRSTQKKSKRASRFESKLEPLTDRYGFIYDTRNLTLLREASDAGAPAPAVFAGLPRVEPEEGDDEEDDWVENNILLSPPRQMSPLSSDSIGPKPSSVDMLPSPSSASGVSLTFADHLEGATTGAAPPSSKNGRHRSSTVLSLNPSPVRAVAAPQQVHVSADVTPTDIDEEERPSHRQAFGLTGRKTIQLLLTQLSEIHERQQTAQKTAWDAFLKRRSSKRSESSSEGFVGFAAMATSGKTGKDDHKEFVELVRGGIPIIYRSKVWVECSGAHDLMAPGEYAELLEQAEKEGIASTTMAEIEKDVVRTLPLNVFFGGDGPGVPKLRRLLMAYAWRNLDLGYCQGLNMLAATLLLTHEREEEAFWVFTCIVERLMPPDYYTPSLLCSRADQRVLQDLVRQELPLLEAHLAEMGVEVAAVSFAWFLSLFTDCLPVETLFRLWDLFFVEGFDVFFRCAIAILKINEAALMACDNIGTLYESLEACTSRLWSPDQLFAVELDLQSRILHTDIITSRAVHVSALMEELAL